MSKIRRKTYKNNIYYELFNDKVHHDCEISGFYTHFYVLDILKNDFFLSFIYSQYSFK